MKLISVVMAVRNGMPFLADSIDSILKQSWANIEFIVIDDASSDESLRCIQGFQDERLKVIRNSRREGLAKSLNKGLDASNGEFIARMDADDISLPTRIEKQVHFMLANSAIDLCGTWASTIGSQRNQLWKYPLRDEEIKAEMLFASVLVHSSVMFRKESVAKHCIRYDEKLEAAQDYELWSRISSEATFANVPEVLLEYRLHKNQIGEKKSIAQQKVSDGVREGQLKRLGMIVGKEDGKRHHEISRWNFGDTIRDLKDIENWLKQLIIANSELSVFDFKALNKSIESRWWAACRAHIANGMDTWKLYKASSLSKLAERSNFQKAILFAKTGSRQIGLRK